MTKKNKKKRNFSFGNMFEVQLLFKNFPFLAFLTFIGLIYIANTHRAEKKIRKIQHLHGEIDESKWLYWESNSNVSYEGIQSQTEKRVQDLGLKAGEGSIKIIEDDLTVQEEE